MLRIFILKAPLLVLQRELKVGIGLVADVDAHRIYGVVWPIDFSSQSEQNIHNVTGYIKQIPLTNRPIAIERFFPSRAHCFRNVGEANWTIELSVLDVDA